MQTTIDNNQKITLLNPFSVSLEKYPFLNIEGKPIYVNGDYKIYSYRHKHYLHTYKNIVFAERCAPNKDMINNLINDHKPQAEVQAYFDYERAKGAIAEGMEAAKKLNFIIN